MEAKYGDYLQLCTTSGCSNFIYVSAGATKAGDIQQNTPTSPAQYTKSPPPAEITVSLPTCTLKVTAAGASAINGETLEISKSTTSVSASLTLNSNPPSANPLPKIDWGNQQLPLYGNIQEMTGTDSPIDFKTVTNSLKVIGYGRITIDYPYCSNKPEVYYKMTVAEENAAIDDAAYGDKADCSLHIFKRRSGFSGLEDEVYDSNIASGTAVSAVLNVSRGKVVSPQSVVWGDLGSSSLTGVPDKEGGKIIYTMSPLSQDPITLTSRYIKTHTCHYF
ncbi:MAG: hypothetical protein HYS80_01415 [Candidatus Aenigmarchaeota archaeon]|nr:hypothetical protein [Candidatus Aenigmarchaeota archaeon]